MCWGLENREASVRFLIEGESNPHGANVEVKIIDPSANVYLASAAILALALDGIRSGRELPAEIPGDPARLSEDERHRANVRLLSDSPAAIIDTLDKSRLARGLLGDAIVDATVAVRRYEQRTSAELAPTSLPNAFDLPGRSNGGRFLPGLRGTSEPHRPPCAWRVSRRRRRGALSELTQRGEQRTRPTPTTRTTRK